MPSVGSVTIAGRLARASRSRRAAEQVPKMSTSHASAHRTQSWSSSGPETGWNW
jgi:hypothetical protein